MNRLPFMDKHNDIGLLAMKKLLQTIYLGHAETLAFCLQVL